MLMAQSKSLQKRHTLWTCLTSRYALQSRDYHVIGISSAHSSPQAARQGLDKCKQQRSSASSDAERAEADIGIELYETLIKALE